MLNIYKYKYVYIHTNKTGKQMSTTYNYRLSCVTYSYMYRNSSDNIKQPHRVYYSWS